MSARENSVRHLANFYTVIAGLALTTAVYQLVNEKSGLLPFTWPKLLLCLAFLVTLFPFYHGALRHLDVTYVEVKAGSKEPKAGAFIGDFALLFTQSCLFIVLAIEITEPVLFTLVYAGLLLFDTIWAVLANWAFSAPTNGKQELTWAAINFCTLCVVFAFMYSQGLVDNLTTNVNPLTIGIVTCVIAWVRTIVDYWASWKHGYYSWR